VWGGSVTCLENHLQTDPEAYKEYLSKKSKTTAEKASGSSTTQTTIANHFQSHKATKSNFKESLTMWIIDDCSLMMSLHHAHLRG